MASTTFKQAPAVLLFAQWFLAIHGFSVKGYQIMDMKSMACFFLRLMAK